jgi:ElaB/YqjD/DUF883 family membrane-anchored ribosome-binding protein
MKSVSQLSAKTLPAEDKCSVPYRPRSALRITFTKAGWISEAIPAPLACHMMESAMTHSSSEAMKQKLLADFNAVVTEAEQLLRLVTDEGGDKANALRTKVEQNLNAAKKRLRSLEDAVMEKTKATARATDEYVHENPWQTVGIAAGLSVVFGVVIGLLLYRR